MKWWSLQLRVDRSNFSNPGKTILQIHQLWIVVLRSSASTHASGFGDDLSPSVGMIDQNVGLPFQWCHLTVVDNHDFGLIFHCQVIVALCISQMVDCHMKYIWICSLNAFFFLYQILWFFISMILSRSRAFLPHGDYGQVGRWSCLNLNVHLEGCLMFSLCNGTVMNWTHWWMWFWGKTIGFCRSSCWSAQWEVNGLGEVLRIFKDVWNTFWVIHWTWNWSECWDILLWWFVRANALPHPLEMILTDYLCLFVERLPSKTLWEPKFWLWISRDLNWASFVLCLDLQLTLKFSSVHPLSIRKIL